MPVFTQYTHLNKVETFLGFVHQRLDDLPNISYVGSLFLACMVFPAQPFQTTPCLLKRHVRNHTGCIAIEPSTNILYASSQSVKANSVATVNTVS